jgi:hypothetical protein
MYIAKYLIVLKCFAWVLKLKAFPFPLLASRLGGASQRQRKNIYFSAISAPRAKRAVNFDFITCSAML